MYIRLFFFFFLFGMGRGGGGGGVKVYTGGQYLMNFGYRYGGSCCLRNVPLLMCTEVDTVLRHAISGAPFDDGVCKTSQKYTWSDSML